eukprot:4330067-Prymnesium_polylepis.1
MRTRKEADEPRPLGARVSPEACTSLDKLPVADNAAMVGRLPSHLAYLAYSSAPALRKRPRDETPLG